MIIALPLHLMNSAMSLPRELGTILSFLNSGATGSAIFFAVNLAFGVIQAVFEFLLGLFIVRRSRHIVLAGVGTIAAGLCGLICLVAAYLLESSLTLAGSGSLSIGIVLGLIVFIGVSFLILLYLVRSVHLRTYMGSADYLTKSMLKFVKPPTPVVPDPPMPQSRM